MKSLIHIFLTGVVSLSALASCDTVLVDIEEPSADQEAEGIPVPLELMCEPLDTELDEPESKSLHDISSLKKISNANYYLFRNDVLVKQEYVGDMENFAVIVPDRDAKYNLYIVTNVGEKKISESVTESGIAAAVHMDYESKSKYFSTIETYGFPMTAIIQDFSYATSGEISLKRLVHTLYVRISEEELATTDMTFTSLTINQAPRDIYPFAPDSKGDYTITGDAANLDADEIEALNRGEKIALYVLESMRGELFPGNKSWKNRIPNNVISSDTDEDKMCPYIELTAQAQTATSYYENNIYRAYLGTTVTDCNVRRSRYSTITNNYVNDMIVDEGWRVESDTPVVNQTLAFVKTASSRSVVTEAMTYPGFVKEVYIYRSNPDIEFTLTSDDAAGNDVWYTTEKVDEHYTRVKLRTDLSWSDYGISSETLTLKSKDGVITSTMTAKANAGSGSTATAVTINPKCSYYYFSDGEEEHTKEIIMQTSSVFVDPIQVRITASGTLDGYLKTFPNGTKKDPVESTYTETISDVCTEYVGTATKELAFNFYKYLNGIHNNTGKSSRNKRNGDDWYYKHAHPTDLKLNYKVEFGKSADGTLYPSNSSITVPVNVAEQQYSTKSDGTPYGAGTDWGIIYWHTDLVSGTADDADVYFIRYETSIYGKATTYNGAPPLELRIYKGQRINVKFNGIDKWTDNPPKATYIGG